MQELEEAEKWRTDVPERYSGSSFMRRELSLVEREADRRFLQAAQRPSSAPAAPAGLAATQRPRTAEDVLQAALLPAPGAAARRRPATAQLPRAGFGSSAPRLAGAAQSGAAAATLRPGMVTGGARRAEEARALGPGCYGDMQHVGALQWHHEHGTLRPGKEFLHTHSAPVLVTFPKRREHQARVKRASECPGPGHYDPPGALGRPWQCSPAPGKSFARRRPRAAGRGPAAAPAAQ
ncbi:unnamed protein product [Prorocentrum cordatum]|uniref:Uncharacterized protein n=1 Tax=Prorocentrum cordatum TaxID=2364126 RepID=A0ABN9W0M1_9DINO|nr:unnamed protein product [Polarella glacialis]